MTNINPIDLPAFTKALLVGTGKIDSNLLVEAAEKLLDEKIATNPAITPQIWHLVALACKSMVIGDKAKNTQLYNSNKSKAKAVVKDDNSGVLITMKKLFDAVELFSDALGVVVDRKCLEYGILCRTKHFISIAEMYMDSLTGMAVSPWKAIIYKSFLPSTVSFDRVFELYVREWRVVFAVVDYFQVPVNMEKINAKTASKLNGMTSQSDSYQVKVDKVDTFKAKFKSSRPETEKVAFDAVFMDWKSLTDETGTHALLSAACVDIHKLVQTHQYKQDNDKYLAQIGGLIKGVMEKYMTQFRENIVIPAEVSNEKTSEFVQLWFKVRSVYATTIRNVINLLWPQGKGKTVVRKIVSANVKAYSF